VNQVAPRAKRLPAVDALRGVAMVSMLAANLAGPCLIEPHPLWLRIFGSFAAPAFVFLAGMMTSFGRGAALGRLLQRSVLLLALAIAIDVLCWGIAPFETFDVLYLLALALPLSGLCRYLPLGSHALLTLAILVAAPWLRARLGYGPTLPDDLAYPWPVWRRLLVDGWFPIFPWLGVALAGGLAGRLDILRERMRPWLALLGTGCMALGAAGWFLAPPKLVTRAGYSELFYPPSAQYLAIALGATLLALTGLERLSRRYALSWLAMLGRASLLLYVVHVALIALVLDELFRDQPLPTFLILLGGLAGTLWLLAWSAERRRSRGLV
jgi:uncharacterized membrane protein